MSPISYSLPFPTPPPLLPLKPTPPNNHLIPPVICNILSIYDMLSGFHFRSVRLFVSIDYNKVSYKGNPEYTNCFLIINR